MVRSTTGSYHHIFCRLVWIDDRTRGLSGLGRLVGRRWLTVTALSVSALFVNELWHHSIVPLSNGPVWSIGFEFWYYVIFAAIIFPAKFRLALSLAAMVIAGPRILLLFPVWLTGVVAYHVGSRWPARSSLGISVFCLSLSLLAGCYVLKLNYMLSDVSLRLLGGSIDDWRYADKFLWSYLSGLLIVRGPRRKSSYDLSSRSPER
jgi:hypothetical protein